VKAEIAEHAHGVIARANLRAVCTASLNRPDSAALSAVDRTLPTRVACMPAPEDVICIHNRQARRGLDVTS
jgi:hypothetical protein